ncbi:MAG: efflux RND transporter periplasmic adaptor subunit [Bacteroidota bacterium]|nr:efflux RND transporter periplasmic adaptor subunit [Bacteroidota bacterium]MDP4233487.1 efflux RND transporter periplasmic adaptor subunit [Bacteroidota bacterium]MDP4243365.1 efflux RND transporter periplasmic adaptor subunit [Bacteroidota bacterium]MDP4287949.1 efflux RND transporter periplasmic adaptor subunit [Bacteroidota bacterium]
MNRSLKYVLLALAALVVVFIIYRIVTAAKPPAPKKQPTPLVRVAHPVREDVIYKLDYDGDVIPVLQANIFSRVTGLLEAVYTDMGRTVRRGQLLALIDTAAAHQAELQAAASYYNARAAEARTRDLAKKNLAAQQDLDNAVATLRTAEAAYESAKIQLSYSKITAPFHGFVTKRWLDPGAVVSSNPIAGNSNTTILTIMDIDTVRVDVNVLDADVAKIPKAKQAIVTLNTLPGREFRAFVATSSQAISTTTRTMQVEILIPNHDQAIKPGSFAHVQLITGENPDALTVPPEAVLRDSAGSFVLVAQDSIAKRKSVQTGVTQNGRLEILSGLDGTEQVIVVGQTFAKPNGKIQIVRTPSPADATRNRFDTTQH